MGFVAPGRCLKRKKKGTIPEKRKLVRLAPSLDSLPAEILCEIFIYSEFSNLPLVNKRLNGILSPTFPLKLSSLKPYTHDLNGKVRSLDESFPSEFSIDKSILSYKFVSADLLRSAKVCSFLSREDFSREANERGQIYSQYLKENCQPPKIGVLGEKKVLTDFPPRFYRSHIENSDLIHFLRSCNVRFFHEGDALCGLFDCVDDESQLTEYEWTMKSFSKIPIPIQPLIHLLRRGFFQTAQHYIARYVDLRTYCRDENLWAFALVEQKNNLQLVHFLEEQGFQPCVKSLTYIS